jgi:hypothetical protein
LAEESLFLFSSSAKERASLRKAFFHQAKMIEMPTVKKKLFYHVQTLEKVPIEKNLLAC